MCETAATRDLSAGKVPCAGRAERARPRIHRRPGATIRPAAHRHGGTMSIDVAIAIAELVRQQGGRALVVGGWTRDRLLGHQSKDVDLEVYGIPALQLKALLETIAPVNVVGESFTVYKVANVDVALPRRESKSGVGHRGFAVIGDPEMTPEEAARRRDFT